MKISVLKQSKCLILTLALFCGNLLAQGVTNFDGKTFIESCNKLNSEVSSSTCVAYLQGFLDGFPDIIEKDKIPSDYMLRATKTRARKGDTSVNSILNAKYCVPDKQFISKLVQKISKIQYDPKQHQLASSVIVSVLEENYRCSH